MDSSQALLAEQSDDEGEEVNAGYFGPIRDYLI